MTTYAVVAIAHVENILDVGTVDPVHVYVGHPDDLITFTPIEGHDDGWSVSETTIVVADSPMHALKVAVGQEADSLSFRRGHNGLMFTDRRSGRAR